MGELIEFHNWDEEIQASNLVTNGNQELEDITNFSGFTYVASGDGYFSLVSGSTTRTSTEYIPVNRYDTYGEQMTIRNGGVTTDNRCYLGLICYDKNKVRIASEHQLFYDSTFTTLAANLTNGQTTVSLTDGTGWNNVTASAKRIGFWGSQFTPYPDGTMTHAVYSYSSVSGNTVTLSSAWSGGTVPAGTVVANHFSGGTYTYNVASNPLLGNDWVTYIDAGGMSGWASKSAAGFFRYGTFFVKIMMLLNRGASTDTTHVRNIKFWNQTTGEKNFDYGNGLYQPKFTSLGTAEFLEFNETGPTEGLHAWYKADGDATDTLGNYTDLGLANSPTYEAGVDGQAYRLNGTTSYVATPNFAWDAYDSWTISFWVYRESPLTSEAFLMGSGYSIRLFGAGSYTFIQDDGTYRSGSYTLPTLNAWTHYAVMFDVHNLEGRIYRNGVIDETQTAFTGVNRAISVAYFGYANGGGAPVTYYYLNGKIDDMRIYKRDLSAQEIWGLYTSYGQGDQKVSIASNGVIYTGGQILEN